MRKERSIEIRNRKERKGRERENKREGGGLTKRMEKRENTKNIERDGKWEEEEVRIKGRKRRKGRKGRKGRGKEERGEKEK